MVVAVIDLVEYKEAISLWHLDKRLANTHAHQKKHCVLIEFDRDCLLWCLAFFTSLLVGIMEGLLLGVIASMMSIIYRVSYPPVGMCATLKRPRKMLLKLLAAILGRLPHSHTYLNVKRFPQVITIKGLAIIRIDASLWFANAEYVKKKFRSLLQNYNSI